MVEIGAFEVKSFGQKIWINFADIVFHSFPYAATTAWTNLLDIVNVD